MLIVVAVVSVLVAVAGSTSVAADAFAVVVAAVALAVASAVVAVIESLDYSSAAVVAVAGETGDCPEPEADMSRQRTQVVLLPISLLRMD